MFENLDIVQVILIGIGLAIVASIFLKPSEDNKPAPKPTPPPIVPVDVHEKEHSHDFMCLVQKWYELKSCAHDQGLHHVCNVLDSQVFPLLNEGEEPEEVKS